MGDLDLDTSNRGELAVSVATPEISAAINEQRKIEAQLNPVLQDSDRESRILNDLDQNLAVKLAAFYERINPRFDGLEGKNSDIDGRVRGLETLADTLSKKLDSTGKKIGEVKRCFKDRRESLETMQVSIDLEEVRQRNSKIGLSDRVSFPLGKDLSDKIPSAQDVFHLECDCYEWVEEQLGLTFAAADSPGRGEAEGASLIPRDQHHHLRASMSEIKPMQKLLKNLEG